MSTPLRIIPDCRARQGQGLTPPASVRGTIAVVEVSFVRADSV
ncbi:hypothetical protein KKC1_08730 [Calderihabitans maritimus]|uniref:Uncharacterized protein n=1 Tax=Calderihabitans maritimus TaxID=1246530 RepID=A0A1Z5HQA2_9FIRM|nr:hypothetical protein KKC1_08730 [Calderihabitans maritimus]